MNSGIFKTDRYIAAIAAYEAAYVLMEKNLLAGVKITKQLSKEYMESYSLVNDLLDAQEKFFDFKNEDFGKSNEH